MNKEHKYIEFMLNPPEVFEEGQVWKSPSKRLEFVITEVLNKEIVRAAFITSIKEVVDKGDVCLTEDPVMSEVFAVEKFVLRITDRPIPTKYLTVYEGKVTPETLKKIKASLKNKTYDYDELQRVFIDELLEDLEPYSMEALEIYEDSLPRIFPINLPYVENYSIEKKIRLAANDFATEEKDLEFWRKERDSLYRHELPFEIPGLLIRISNVDNVYYLIIVSNQFKKIDKINITEENGSFLKMENLEIPDSNRIAIPINKAFNEDFPYNIEVIIDSKVYSLSFVVNYDKQN
ncbi:hypothetical protein [Melioribacter sp. OK-6-Me]|uniref:hypothetical protein n=1 Tax=unclassified Melioribacter TaxID=2627329 RepID=UPI003EDB30C8